MIDRRVYVGEVVDRGPGLRTRAAADGRGTLRLASPATFQFVKSGIELAPLASREKAPFEGVLQTVVVFTFAAAGQLGASTLNIQTVENRMVPRPIICPFANQAIELAPVFIGDFLGPIVELAQNNANAPERAGVANTAQERNGLINALLRFFVAWPLWKLCESRAVGRASGVEIADDHVIKQHIVQPARAEAAANKMSVYVKDGERF